MTKAEKKKLKNIPTKRGKSVNVPTHSGSVSDRDMNSLYQLFGMSDEDDIQDIISGAGAADAY